MNINAISSAVPVKPDIQADPNHPEERSSGAAESEPGNDSGQAMSPAVETPLTATPPPAIHLPVEAKGLALGILATVAVVFAWEWAQSFVISLLLGILFAYTLNPLVVWLERGKIPRVLSASIVMLGVLCALVLGSYALQGQIQKILIQLPETTSKFSAGLASLGAGQRDTMENVQAAATEVEKATSQVTGSPPKPRATHVVIDPPAFKINDFIWTSSISVMAFAGQALMVVFLVFFLLLSADTFKRKLVRLTGPTLSRSKDHCAYPRWHQQLHPELYVHAFSDQCAGRAAGLDRLSLDRSRECRRLGRRGRFTARDPLFRPGRHGCRHQHGGDVTVWRVFSGDIGRGDVPGHCHFRRHLRHCLDDRKDRQNEYRGDIYFAAVLGLAVGDLGHAPEHSDHRHHESRLPACRTAAAGRGTPGRIVCLPKSHSSIRLTGQNY